MSLKTDYNISSSLKGAFDSGKAWVTTNRSLISSNLVSNAAKGNKVFTVTILTTDNTPALRLNGPFLQYYLEGITAGLAGEDIYSFECDPTLNTSDINATSIDLNFTFA